MAIVKREGLPGVTVAFCDSLEALRQARHAGLPESARVRTDAPAVALSGLSSVEPLHGADATRKLLAYWQAARPLAEAVFRSLSADPHLAPFALLAARSAHATHRLLTKMTALSEADFTEPRAALLVETGDAVVDRRFNTPWHSLLADNPQLQTHSFSVPVPQARPLRTTLWSKFQRFDRALALYRLGLLAGRLGRGRATPHALVVRENELIEEACAALFLSGFSLEQVKKPDGGPDDDGIALFEAVSAAIAPALATFVTEWMPAAGRPAAGRMMTAQLKADIRVFCRDQKAWGQVLDRQQPGRPAVVLTNFPGGAGMLALGKACEMRGIPLVSAQHGVTRELCGMHDVTDVNYESSVADLYLAFNREAVHRTNLSPFRKGRSVAVGVPSVYRRLHGTSARHLSDAPILYVSTALLAGNVNQMVGGLTDIDRVQREIDIAGSVLAQLPHRVTYKTYPSRDRYPDTDPLLFRLSQHSNISVFDQPIDLRYLLRRFQVLVASRATSTIAWCLASGKPLVFINMPDHAALRPEVHQAMADAVFLFDWNAGATDRLRAFLSQPLQDIQKAWQAKAAPRQQFMERYITGPEAGAGKLAAQAILAYLEEGGRND